MFLDEKLNLFGVNLSKFEGFDMVSIDENSIAIPGERLGSLEQFTPGNGTYIRHGYLFSSLAGYKHVLQQQNGEVRMNITE